MNRFIRTCACVALTAGFAGTANAVIIMGDITQPNNNYRNALNINNPLDGSFTNPPGNLNRFVGAMGSFTGTVISPRHMITATHVIPGSSTQFVFANGTSTATTYNMTLVGTQDDLAIYELDSGQPSFGIWTNLWTNSNEVGNQMVVLGRGTQRGNAVFRNGTHRGWEWGTGDSVLAWGTNLVSATPTINIGAPFNGSFLQFTFSDTSSFNEAAISPGDSSGPVFVWDGSNWLLAGINSLVDNVRLTANGAFADAALFDARNFFAGGTELTGPDPIPLSGYSTRISSRIQWINGIIPEPASLSIVMLGGFVLLARRRAA
jgi:hypothetical protein